MFRKRRTKTKRKHRGVIDLLDLRVNTKKVPLTKIFSFIGRLFFTIRWASNTPNFTLFGGITALTNGIQITENTLDLLPETLKDNGDFFQYKLDTIIDQDAVATKNNILNSRLSFWKFTGDPRGLDVRGLNDEFFIDVKDDLTSATNTKVICIAEGFRFE